MKIDFDEAPAEVLHPADRDQIAASLLAAWSKTLSLNNRPAVTYSNSLHQRMTAIGPDWYIPYYQGDRLRFKKLPESFDSLFLTDRGLLCVEYDRIMLEEWSGDSTKYDRYLPVEINRGYVHGDTGFFNVSEIPERSVADGRHNEPASAMTPERRRSMKTVLLDIVSGNIERELSFPGQTHPVVFLDAAGPLGLWLELGTGNLFLMDLRTQEARKVFP
jgi:hypothetical protein